MYTLDTYHFVFIGALWKIKYKLIGTADYRELVDKLYVRLIELRMDNMYVITRNNMYELLWNKFNLFEQINDIYCVKLA